MKSNTAIGAESVLPRGVRRLALRASDEVVTRVEAVTANAARACACIAWQWFSTHGGVPCRHQCRFVPTSTCYGTMLDQAEPWLSGPKFFPITWAEAQAQPAESPLTEPELQHTGSSGSPQGSSFDHPLAVGGSLVVGRSGALRSARCNALSAEAVSWGPGTEVVARRFGVDHSFAALEPTNPREQPAGVSLSPCRTRVFPSLGHGQVVPSPGPHTQPSACQEGTPAPDAYTISLHAALSTSPRDKRQAARGGSGQPRGPTRAGLWASTRRQRTANKEWSTRRSNSLFWRSWQPETCSPTKRQKVVAPTPRDKTVHPEPVCAGDGLSTAPPSGTFPLADNSFHIKLQG